MKVWVITDHDGRYVSAWRSAESAEGELDKLNARYRKRDQRDRYDVQEAEVNG